KKYKEDDIKCVVIDNKSYEWDREAFNIPYFDNSGCEELTLIDRIVMVDKCFFDSVYSDGEYFPHHLKYIKPSNDEVIILKGLKDVILNCINEYNK
ncbi:unnamed protein product, partial [marine sediment metagenome]